MRGLTVFLIFRARQSSVTLMTSRTLEAVCLGDQFPPRFNMAYRASSLRGLAIAQMVFGALMLVFGIASIAAVAHWISYVGFGIWVGIWVSTMM